MMDISIITPCCRPLNLIRFMDQLSQQSCEGISYELILILESNHGTSEFTNCNSPLLTKAKILKSKVNDDYGAKAKDLGLLYATGQYVLFWDDDNIYFKHAIASQYANAQGVDIGISKAYHLNYTIPYQDKIEAGDIDTINICLRRDLARKASWSHNGTKYSDYFYISELLKHDPSIRRSNIIIGHHL